MSDATTADGAARLFVIVPAAGGGARFGSGRRKQYEPLNGTTLVTCTLQRLAGAFPDATIALAVAPDDVEHAPALRDVPARIEVLTCGGATRALTVRNALAWLAQGCRDHDWLLVHDAARPCVPVEALHRLRTTLADDPVGGLLAVPVTDTLKRAGDGDTAHGPAPRVARTEDRTGLWQAQTPQMFRFGVLRAAFEHAQVERFTDEAQAVETLAQTGACLPPRLVPGSALNIKVTYPADLELAQTILHMQREHRT